MSAPSPLAAATRAVVRDVERMTFAPPVTHVYNPLVYARRPHALYVERFGTPPKEVLFVGMNPGPFGMTQTGVPFGEVAHVRGWLGIEAPVDRPPHEHPRRPVLGFDCPRSEVSGRRLWGWAAERFGTPERFFARFYVHNYCPLVFMAESGRNITPDKLPAEECATLFTACDRYLRAACEALRPQLVVGIGAFAEKRARAALQDFDVGFGRIPHPSPASPAANRGWAEAADRALEDLRVEIPAPGAA